MKKPANQVSKKNDKKQDDKNGSIFETIAAKITRATGSTPAILIAFTMVLIWAALGPVFDFSETWQLVINTGTTIITFLMVFLIQKTQNKDSLALQLKLDELVASNELASNTLVDVEDMTEDELRTLQKYYKNFTASKKKNDDKKDDDTVKAEKIIKNHTTKSK